MRGFIGTLITCLFFASQEASALTILSGQSLTLNYDFSADAFQGPYTVGIFGVNYAQSSNLSDAVPLTLEFFDSGNNLLGSRQLPLETGSSLGIGAPVPFASPTLDPIGAVIFSLVGPEPPGDVDPGFVIIQSIAIALGAVSPGNPLRLTGFQDPFAGNPFPLPATLPLFATGLGALGLFGWKSKRRRDRLH